MSVGSLRLKVAIYSFSNVSQQIIYTALYRYAASVAECVGGLCIAAGCSTWTSA